MAEWERSEGDRHTGWQTRDPPRFDGRPSHRSYLGSADRAADPACGQGCVDRSDSRFCPGETVAQAGVGEHSACIEGHSNKPISLSTSRRKIPEGPEDLLSVDQELHRAELQKPGIVHQSRPGAHCCAGRRFLTIPTRNHLSPLGGWVLGTLNLEL